MIQSFRLLGYAECASFLVLLLIAMPLKYLMGMPEAVKLVGAIHGGLFLLFIFSAVGVGMKLNWSFGRILAAWVIAVIPFGPILFEKRLFAQVNVIERA